MPKTTSANPLPPLDERISFLLHRISAQVFLICNPYFREYGIDLHNSRMPVILMEDEEARRGSGQPYGVAAVDDLTSDPAAGEAWAGKAQAR